MYERSIRASLAAAAAIGLGSGTVACSGADPADVSDHSAQESAELLVRPASVDQAVPRSIEGVSKTVTKNNTILLGGLDKRGNLVGSLEMWRDATGEHAVWSAVGTTLYADRLYPGADTRDAEDHVRLVTGDQTIECSARLEDTDAQSRCWETVDSRAPGLKEVRQEWVAVQIDFRGELASEIAPPGAQANPDPAQGARTPDDECQIVCGATCVVFSAFLCYTAAGAGCGAISAPCGPIAIACGVLCGFTVGKPACDYVANQICHPQCCSS